jgi:hypothetical protein
VEDAPTVKNEATIAAALKERQNNVSMISTEPKFHFPVKANKFPAAKYIP